MAVSCSRILHREWRLFRERERHRNLVNAKRCEWLAQCSTLSMGIFDVPLGVHFVVVSSWWWWSVVFERESLTRPFIFSPSSFFSSSPHLSSSLAILVFGILRCCETTRERARSQTPSRKARGRNLNANVHRQT
ncbi:hypothetical protein CPB86DRAFT_48795 [Serendipita vermifera]|nr:hypothetical protein CPB86DRAFT_48795 [Serendipita vermifera]